ncbi:MAG: arsenate reductase (glutaredoxin) [Paludibacterium sp.]|uniref:arsenate reductase (glutaredoxin) n=1 Tax=Paludibacterium sp. TaxID=1917523 RepID=UPI0025EE063B|nr:arsenate reductase (glutaredoxin) [Paludibacterium sp.]MBV8047255.1 arsenate reductase (glutaredoxin) [Paludibacterium sp.]MBV8647928.1 arsenate reductase (glutaredoxin) [Paludibacterium sp.]
MIRFYHNPRCSKSREALQLLRDRGIKPEVIDYLKNPPSEAELERILTLLQLDARDLLRSKEPEFEALHLDDVTLEPKHLIRAMVMHPRLIERPIAVDAQRAVIGRPPEKVLSLLS